MIEIPLTQEKTAIVDDDMEHLAKYKWQFNGNGYAVRMVRRLDGERKTMFLHHCVVGFPLNGMQIDHIDGNRLNDQRKNLRIVSRRENQWNRKEHRGEKIRTSRFIGVYWRKDMNSWQAGITINKKPRYLGLFKDEEKAAEAYQEALKKMEVLCPL